MDIYTSYGILNGGLLEVLDSVNVLNEIPDPEKEDYVRLVENPFVLTQDTKRNLSAVTAHNLYQYTNKFYSMELKDEASTWLEELLSIDFREDMV